MTIPGDPGIVITWTEVGAKVAGITTGLDQAVGIETVGGIVTTDGTGETIGTIDVDGNVDGIFDDSTITIDGDDGIVTTGIDVGRAEAGTATGLVHLAGIVTMLGTTTTTVVTCGATVTIYVAGYVDGSNVSGITTTPGDPGIVTYWCFVTVDGNKLFEITTGDDQTVGTETDGGRKVTVTDGGVTAGTIYSLGTDVGTTLIGITTIDGDPGIVTYVVTDIGNNVV
jgi:hypothetical protein